MIDHSPEPRDRSRTIQAWIAGTLALALAGGVAATWWTSAPVLHAAVSGLAGDMDGDGLPDALELRLGTDPTSADSDGDGVGDAEEVARKSDPTDGTWLPESAGVAINLLPYIQNGTAHLLTVIYSPDGSFADKPIRMGARIGNSVRAAPLIYFTKNATFSLHAGNVAGSAVAVIDSPVDDSLLERFPSISFYTLIQHNGKKVDAGVTDLAMIDGVLIEYTAGSLIAAAKVGARSSQLATSYYGPVDADAILEWTPGEICGQITAVAATMGPVIIEEVVSAGCEPGWDSYCDPGCSASVGDTLQRIDPIALING